MVLLTWVPVSLPGSMATGVIVATGATPPDAVGGGASAVGGAPAWQVELLAAGVLHLDNGHARGEVEQLVIGEMAADEAQPVGDVERARLDALVDRGRASSRA